MFMKTLAALMAVAIALAWPAPGEAQSRKKKQVRAKTQQTYVAPRTSRVCDRVQCVYRHGYNFGTDPDPFIRNDLGRDNPYSDP
jgi:hypothetical protein